MRVHDCNRMMLEEYLKHDDRVVLPIGSTEQHGYRSVGTDTGVEHVREVIEHGWIVK